jgi:hypothetical protein
LSTGAAASRAPELPNIPVTPAEGGVPGAGWLSNATVPPTATPPAATPPLMTTPSLTVAAQTVVGEQDQSLQLHEHQLHEHGQPQPHHPPTPHQLKHEPKPNEKLQQLDHGAQQTPKPKVEGHDHHQLPHQGRYQMPVPYTTV